MRSIIFGTEKIGVDFYFDIRKDEEVIAFVDNDIQKQGKEILGIRVFPVNGLLELEFDKIYIASLFHYRNMESQIMELGIPKSKILFTPIETYKKQQKSGELTQLSENCNKAINCLYQFQEVWHEKEFEDRWDQIRNNYEEIIIYQLCASTIGETIARFFMIIENISRDDRILRVYIPDTEEIRRICNKYLIKMLRKNIYIIQEDEVAFWIYIMIKHSSDLNFSEYKRYDFRNDYLPYKLTSNAFHSCFTDSELKKGNEAMIQMGLDTPFVCMAARTSAYNNRTIGTDFFYEPHNVNFEDYELTIRFLEKQNIMAVKMGRMEDPMRKIENCIDYAGLYADDFMDLYLLSKCKFMIANGSGITMMASLFSKPVLMVNTVVIAYGYGGMAYADNSLYIPKKYYKVDEDRFLTLREIMEIEYWCSGEYYEKAGIKFIDNTQQEIAEATKEIIERLEGRWYEDAEDRKNYMKYMEIYHEMERTAASNPNNWIGAPVPFRIAATYLKENTYLLL